MFAPTYGYYIAQNPEFYIGFKLIGDFMISFATVGFFLRCHLFASRIPNLPCNPVRAYNACNPVRAYNALFSLTSSPNGLPLDSFSVG